MRDKMKNIITDSLYTIIFIIAYSISLLTETLIYGKYERY